MMTYEEYLKGSAVREDIIEAFLDPEKRKWAQFDSELGYIHGRNILPPTWASP
jgi:hypothetical protein